jgi:ADP-heptose:LPS heptosyltransferase
MAPETLKKLDSALWPAAVAPARAAAFFLRGRQPDPRPLVVRPGGMGDLILLCVAIENLGRHPRDFFWLIERRSRVWARHLGLDYLCYDERPLARHLRIAGRFALVINSEQRFGLSQASAALACGRGAKLVCFETNRAARWARVRVPYDPDSTHEAVSFQHLLAAALDLPQHTSCEPSVRARTAPAAGRAIVGLGGLQSESRAFSDDEWARFIVARLGGKPFQIASSETDRPVAHRLARRFPDQAEVFEGGFSELCGLIERAAEVLTVDGGFLHIASYYGVPVVGLFTSGRDRKWAALGQGSLALLRDDLACRPCTWFGQTRRCAHGFACKEIAF